MKNEMSHHCIYYFDYILSFTILFKSLTLNIRIKTIQFYFGGIRNIKKVKGLIEKDKIDVVFFIYFFN